MDEKRNISVVIVAVFALSFVLVYGVLPVLSASTAKSVQLMGPSDVLSNRVSSDLAQASLVNNNTRSISPDQLVPVPTLNEWGAAILTLLMLCAVVTVLRLNRRRS